MERSGLQTKLLLALAAVFAWRAFFSAHVNLIPDECSYWAWSRHLDWSYFDNSGMTAYLIRFSTWLWGESSPFSVRFAFLILSGISTYLIYRISRLLFHNGINAVICAVIFNFTPVGLLGGSAAIHDNALIFFWLICIWALAKMISSDVSHKGNQTLSEPEVADAGLAEGTKDGMKWFLIVGIASGLAIQSKYTGVLAPVCVLIFLLLSKTHRGFLLRKEPWVGAGIALVFVLPIIWWNFRHDWASVHHIFFIGSGSTSAGKRFLDGIGYHAAQFLLVSPLLYLAVLAAAGEALLKNFKRRNPAHILLLSFSAPLPLFGIMAFKGHVEANWAFPGYFSIIILAVEIIHQGRISGSVFWNRFDRRHVLWGVGLSVIPVLLVMLHAWIGLLPAFVEKRFAKEDRIIWETRGWDGLGGHVAELKAPSDVIAADSYQLCALLEFNVPGRPAVRYMAPWKRPTQFDVWEPSFDNLTGKNILFVSSVELVPSSSVRTTIFENFSSVEQLEPYYVMYHGTAVRKIHVYRCIGFDPFSPRRLGPRTLKYD